MNGFQSLILGPPLLRFTVVASQAGTSWSVRGASIKHDCCYYLHSTFRGVTRGSKLLVTLALPSWGVNPLARQLCTSDQTHADSDLPCPPDASVPRM